MFRKESIKKEDVGAELHVLMWKFSSQKILLFKLFD